MGTLDFNLMIQHILLGDRIASLQGSMGTHSWKLWAANYVWTRLMSTPDGLDYVADNRVCVTEGCRRSWAPWPTAPPDGLRRDADVGG